MIAYYTYHGNCPRPAIAVQARGSVIVVAAEEEEIARPLAETWARSYGVDPESLRLMGVARLPQPLVVYAWTGDY